MGLKTDEVRTQEHITKLNEKLDAYEAILSKQKYLAGDVSAPSNEIAEIIITSFFEFRKSLWPISSICLTALL